MENMSAIFLVFVSNSQTRHFQGLEDIIHQGNLGARMSRSWDLGEGLLGFGCGASRWHAVIMVRGHIGQQ